MYISPIIYYELLHIHVVALLYLNANYDYYYRKILLEIQEIQYRITLELSTHLN